MSVIIAKKQLVEMLHQISHTPAKCKYRFSSSSTKAPNLLNNSSERKHQATQDQRCPAGGIDSLHLTSAMNQQIRKHNFTDYRTLSS